MERRRRGPAVRRESHRAPPRTPAPADPTQAPAAAPARPFLMAATGPSASLNRPTPRPRQRDLRDHPPAPADAGRGAARADGQARCAPLARCSAPSNTSSSRPTASPRRTTASRATWSAGPRPVSLRLQRPVRAQEGDRTGRRVRGLSARRGHRHLQGRTPGRPQRPRFLTDFKRLYNVYEKTAFSKFSEIDGQALHGLPHGAGLARHRRVQVGLRRWRQLRYPRRPRGGGVSPHRFPPTHQFRWLTPDRESYRYGDHPHVSIEDRVFVECIGGDLTIKVEDNTATGEGIYAEPVDDRTRRSTTPRSPTPSSAT
jgi:hypothetical protein